MKVNGVHIIDCSEISKKTLQEIQDTKEFKIFTDQFGNAMKQNGIVYLINTEVDKEVVRFAYKQRFELQKNTSTVS